MADEPVVVLSENPIWPSTRDLQDGDRPATVDRMRWHQARGQLWAFVYLAVRQLLGVVLIFCRSEQSKEIELLTLCHEVAVLRRQVGRCAYEPADRALLAASVECPLARLGRPLGRRPEPCWPGTVGW